MSVFDDLSLEGFTGKVRLFPLPNVVLFPHVMQPLHIFEPRYRELLEYAIASDRLIAMAGLAPGWENDYEGHPKLYPTACLGRVTTFVRLADGTYNVLLLGVQRVKLLREVPQVHRFREALVELCADHYPPVPSGPQAVLHQKLHDALIAILPAFPEAQEQLDQLLASDVSLGVLTDVLSYMLDLGMERKQQLLAEIDVYRRTELLLASLAEATAECSETAVANAFPPAFSVN